LTATKGDVAGFDRGKQLRVNGDDEEEKEGREEARPHFVPSRRR
jgi:hypothetical protein